MRNLFIIILTSCLLWGCNKIHLSNENGSPSSETDSPNKPSARIICPQLTGKWSCTDGSNLEINQFMKSDAMFYEMIVRYKDGTASQSNYLADGQQYPYAVADGYMGTTQATCVNTSTVKILIHTNSMGSSSIYMNIDSEYTLLDARHFQLIVRNEGSSGYSEGQSVCENQE